MKALLVVDVQNDFMPWGSFPVSHGDEVIPIINGLIKKFSHVIATQDWHPLDHLSFAVNHGKQPGEIVLLKGIEQILWPIHCVQNTPGAAFVDDLDTSKFIKVFHKGTDKFIDSYSALYDNEHFRSTGLPEYLQKNDIDEIYIVGLTTEYCIKYSALDAIDLGIKVNVFIDGCRGINLHPQDSEQAIIEMKKKGAKILTSKEILESI